MEEKRPFIITIAAVSGGGKTTLTNALTERFSNSKALFFDDYNFDGPSNLCDWTERGSDYNEWDLTPLANDLCSLINNPTESLSYIFLDYPFAYKHSKMNKFIDLTIFIDTPLDIAMARRIIRDFKNVSTEHIIRDAEFYLSRARESYVDMLNTIGKTSDLIVDGSLPIEEMLDITSEKIRKEVYYT
jgi:uridine kinase